jgi:hypothetical protein
VLGELPNSTACVDETAKGVDECGRVLKMDIMMKIN